MSWDHHHRDGTWHQHDDGATCDLDQPAKLRTGGGAHPDLGKVGITEPLTVEFTIGEEKPWAQHDAAVDAALRAQQLRPVPPWSAEYKLRHALGRPALAKRITDALPQPLAVELGDVLWIILQQRVAEELAAVKAQVDYAVSQKLEWYELQATEKREELTRERFGRTTRLD